MVVSQEPEAGVAGKAAVTLFQGFVDFGVLEKCGKSARPPKICNLFHTRHPLDHPCRCLCKFVVLKVLFSQ